MEQEPSGGYTEALGEHASNPPQPRTSGNIVWWTEKNRELRFSTCENRIKGQFEQWVRSSASRVISEVEANEGPETANQMRSAYLADVGAGLYNWDGRHCRTARGDVPGLTYLTFLLVRRCHPEFTLEEAGELFRSQMRDCAQAIKWALGNSPAPAANGQPGETDAEKIRRLEAMEARLMKNPATLDGP